MNHPEACPLFERSRSRLDPFQRFHEANPEVYEALRRLALDARARRPGKRIGIRLLWERLRWHLEFEVVRTDAGPRLQDHFTPMYARLLMEREPSLRGAFETRRRRTA